MAAFAASLTSGLKRAAITGGLEASHLVAATGLMRQARGRGCIFTLHHVRPKMARRFDPNAHLEVTPAFLDAAIVRLKRDGSRFVALADVPAALADSDPRPFAAFTLDDGYRNTLDHASPVFERHGVPYTVFATSGFIDRTQTLWWETLADLLEVTDRLTFDFGQGAKALPLGSVAEKMAAFRRIAAFIRSGKEAEAVARLNSAASDHGIDPLAITEKLTLDAVGIANLVARTGASLGAHTISHRAIARLDGQAALQEMEASAERIAAITGTRPLAFAYPYGDAQAVSLRDHRLAVEAGFSVAVTTQPGVLTASKPVEPSALPRISLNGYYQKPRYVSALASGIPFIWRRDVG